MIRRGRPRPVLDAIEEDVLEYFADRNHASTRAAARDLGIPNHVAVWRVLNANNLHPYHFQTVQDLLPADYNPRLGFARWCLSQVERDDDFLKHVLFTDEATICTAGKRRTLMKCIDSNANIGSPSM